MMRSDLVKRGVERAPHRSLLKGTGNYTDADLDKPFIAVVNSFVEIVPGHAHLDKVGYYVKDAVRAAGGVPFIFNTIGVDDGIAMGHLGMKFSLPSRELIADCVESMIEAHRFDAMICIPNCDKIVPGMMMAAARCNIPAIFVSGGPMEAGKTSAGKKVDLISAFYAVSQHTAGNRSDAELADIKNPACPTCGSCSGMFTANSMNCLAEALGIALPGNGTMLATSEDRKRLYHAAASRIVELAKAGGPLPRDIMTREAFQNAMILDMAMGGSTNTVLHILAIAHEAGVQFTMKDIDALSRKAPNICRLAPSAGRPGTHLSRRGLPRGRRHHDHPRRTPAPDARPAQKRELRHCPPATLLPRTSASTIPHPWRQDPARRYQHRRPQRTELPHPPTPYRWLPSSSLSSIRTNSIRMIASAPSERAYSP
jgi:dihydroxy-acid dehydratase